MHDWDSMYYWGKCSQCRRFLTVSNDLPKDWETMPSGKIVLTKRCRGCKENDRQIRRATQAKKPSY